jgi:hypothetical protein
LGSFGGEFAAYGTHLSTACFSHYNQKSSLPGLSRQPMTTSYQWADFVGPRSIIEFLVCAPASRRIGHWVFMGRRNKSGDDELIF